MKTEYIEFLNTKFGPRIPQLLLDLNSGFSLKKGTSETLYHENLSKENQIVVNNLILQTNFSDEEKRVFEEVINREEWAFDFPGWIGELDFDKKDNVKEIMIIGMEPHIEHRFYQVTYGLRETGEKVFDELSCGNNKKLWSNLNNLFGNSENYHDLDFLEKLYVTDLSHFAVKGKANKIKGVRNWNKLRNEIALLFLQQEINLIKPKYIISQGNDVADFIDKRFFKDNGIKPLRVKRTTEFNTALPEKCKRSPEFSKYNYQNRQIIHMRLPHIASGNTNYFWIPAQKENRKKRIDSIREELDKFEKE